MWLGSRRLTTASRPWQGWVGLARHHHQSLQTASGRWGRSVGAPSRLTWNSWSYRVFVLWQAGRLHYGWNLEKCRKSLISFSVNNSNTLYLTFYAVMTNGILSVILYDGLLSLPFCCILAATRSLCCRSWTCLCFSKFVRRPYASAQQYSTLRKYNT